MKEGREGGRNKEGNEEGMGKMKRKGKKDSRGRKGVGNEGREGGNKEAALLSHEVCT